MTGQKIKKFDVRTLASLASKFNASLEDEYQFYKKISEALNDFEFGFVERQKNTTESVISIEFADQITIYVGQSPFCIEDNLHEAVWKVVLLHIIFKVKFPDTISNLAQALAHASGWTFIPVSRVVMKKCT